MHVGIVTPAASGSLAGNRVTSVRWARMLSRLGHEVSLETTWRGEPWDALIALHARRSADSIQRFDDARPEAPLVVALGGTDVYVDLPAGDVDTRDSLERADHILALQKRAADELPASMRERVVVIAQSSEPLEHPPAAREDVFEVVVVGHLREVKAPLLTAEASRRLPPTSRIAVVHAGGVIDEALAEQVQIESDENPRYTWLGPLDHDETRQLIARARLLSHTSRAEGGANVVSEALVLGTPVIGTQIPGTVGMLGSEYPGYVPVDDVDALAELLDRVETDGALREALARGCAAKRDRYLPAAEEAAWAAFLATWPTPTTRP